MARDAAEAGYGLKRRSPDEVRVVRASENVETIEESNVMSNIIVNRAEHKLGSMPAPEPISQELAKEYCFKLAKVVLRYSTPAEIVAFTELVECYAQGQLGSRFNPGLNDAKYSLYRSYWLKGGAA